MIAPRQLPFPGSPEARLQGCTCPDPPVPRGAHPAPVLDNDCPVHGLAATARDRAGEKGPIDTEGDVVDAAIEEELRQPWKDKAG